MMPSFRQKVAGFIRQLSNPSENRSCEEHQPRSRSDCFIQKYLSGFVILYNLFKLKADMFY